jgi:putative ABC transport system permease protein
VPLPARRRAGEDVPAAPDGRWRVGSLVGSLRAVSDSLGLAIRGLWWRKGVSIAILLVAVTTVLAAAIGPLYAHAGSESILQDTLRTAKVSDVGVEIYENHASTGTPLQNLDAIAEVGRLSGYDKPIHSLQYTGFLPGRPGQVGPQAMLAYREGACAHLVLAAGRCPQRAGEVVVSKRSVPEYPWGLGALLALTGFTDSDSARVPALRVVGLYVAKDRNDPFWFNQNYFSAQVTTCDCPNMGDTLFTPKATFDVASPPEVRALIDVPLDVRSTRFRDTAQLRRQLVALRATLTDSGIGMFSILDKVLDSAKESSRRLGVSVALVTAQLLLLSWFVLYLVVANASESRGPEVALAKLRGLTPARTVAFGLLEPGLLLILATPLGLLAGLAAAAALGHLRLLPGTAVVMTSTTLLATAGALAGAAAAAGLAARGTLRRPVVEQWRRTAGDRRSSGALRHADLVLVTVAVAGLISLGFGGALGNGHTADWVLLAPALVALALALLGVRLLPIAVRAAVRRSRGSRHIGSFVALRQVARRPGGLRIVVLLAVAFALTTFTVAAWSVSSTNRSARAATEIGAYRVLTVDPGRVNLVEAVRRLDPTGRHAMAAAEYFPYGNEPGGLLVAVDATRLPAVGTWRRDFAAKPLRMLAAAVHPATAPRVMVTGRQLALTVTASDLTGSGTAELEADVRSPTTGAASVLLGRIRPGRHVYVGSVATCAAGCELTGLGVPSGLANFAPRSGRLLFTALAARSASTASWAPVGAALSTPGRWTAYRLSPPAKVNRVEASSAGLQLSYAAEHAEVPGVSPFDAPSVLPAVVAGAAVDDPVVGRPTMVTGLDGNKLPVRIAAIARVLPRAGDTGTLLDLEYADRALGTGAYLATRQVWLTADAPADFAARLRAAGVDVLGSASAADRRAVLGRQGPALALLLFLCAAALAALLAAGATIVSIYLAGRRRAFELAAMHAVGVPRRQLLRACLGEQQLLLLTGVALGVLAGLLGAALALRSMPIYSDDVTVPPVHYLPAPLPVGGFLLGAASLTALVAALAAVLLVRSARPARLREVQV